MTVIKEKDAPYPGFAGGSVEAQEESVEIAEGDTTGTATFSLDGAYDGTPVVSEGAELTGTSAGATSSQVDRSEIIGRGTDTVEVEVELDAAPGAGETATVGVGIVVVGVEG